GGHRPDARRGRAAPQHPRILHARRGARARTHGLAHLPGVPEEAPAPDRVRGGEARMRVLFIGGTGVISSACSTLAIEQGVELYLLNRGSSSRQVPEGAQVV